MSGNSFAALREVKDVKRHTVLDKSVKQVNKKKEEPKEQPQQKASKKNTEAQGKGAAAKSTGKGGAKEKHADGPRTLQEAAEYQRKKDEEKRVALEKKKAEEEKKKAAAAAAAAEKAEKGEKAEDGAAENGDEGAAVAIGEEEEGRKHKREKKEEEPAVPVKTLREYEREAQEKRFFIAPKQKRHVDAANLKSLQQLHREDDVLKVPRNVAQKPHAHKQQLQQPAGKGKQGAKGKGAAPAKAVMQPVAHHKTQPKDKKPENKSLQQLAAAQSTQQARRGGGYGRGGPERRERPKDINNQRQFPVLAD